MRNYTSAGKGPVAPEIVRETILRDFPWTKPYIIRVSRGFAKIIGAFLTDIEEILGPDTRVAFLRIVEDATLDDDITSIFQRKIRIFLQPQQGAWATDARVAAIACAIDQATEMAANTCCTCGGIIKNADITDYNVRCFLTFLPKEPENRVGEITHMHVCLPCAQADWWKKKDQSIINEENKRLLSADDANDADEGMFSDLFAYEDDAFFLPALSATADQHIAIFSDEEIDRLGLNYEPTSKDHARVMSLVKQIKDRSSVKRLATIPETWRDYCEDLTKKFPNFGEAIAFIRNQIALSEAGDGVLRFPPFLLAGGPGIGKTEFALTIANDFKTKLEVINIPSAQTGCMLTGSESYYGNTKPGALFTTLALGEVANPIIFLDEIDKAHADTSRSSINALHQLLEQRQARQFHDLSIPELTVDASHVIWIATANNLDAIEATIIDRFKVLNISNPTKEQMPAIVVNQYQRFLDKHPAGSAFNKTINSDVLSELCKHHPRKVRKILEQSFGLAAYERRDHLTVQDILFSASDAQRKTGIGFLREDA